MKFILFFICLITFLFMGESMAQQNINKLSTKELTVNGKVEVNSTTLSSKPCPAMTETQRNAIATPASGSCVYNTSTLQLNVYNGSIWKSAGGGISNWETAFNYAIGDVVIESDKIYQCDTAHTSTVFASDIANWTQIANNVSDATGVLPLANGGTNKNATASAGSVVYSDADSFELTSVGTAGQVLKSNGTSAPAFAASSIKAKAENLSQVDAEEIQFPNNQLTETAAGKYLAENGNFNLLQNPGFEHTTYDTGWTSSGSATRSAETVSLISGKKAYKAVMAGSANDVYQDSTLYAAQLAGMQGYVQVSCSNTAPGATVCARAAGVESTTDCVTMDTTGSWKQYEIPVVLSATSNGIEISTGTTAGTLICDDAYVGLISGKTPEVSQAQLVVSGHFAATASATLSRTNTALGAFGTAAAFPAPTYAINDWGCAATDANKFAITCSNVPAGKVIFRAYAYFFVTSGTADTTMAIFDGTSNTPSQQGTNNSSGAPTVVYGEFNYAAPGSRTFEVYASASGSTINLAAANTGGGGGNPRFEIIYYPPASKIYSQQCQNNPTSCENVHSATVNTAATITGQTSDWLASCSGTTTKTCLFKTNLYSITPSCQVTAIHGGNNFYYGNILAVSTTQIQIQGYRSDSSAVVNTPLTVSCQKQGADYKAQNVITGTFAEMMRVPGVSKPSFFSWKGNGSCVVSDETQGNPINGNGTSGGTGQCAYTLSTGYCSGIPFCWAQANIGLGNSGQCRAIPPVSNTTVQTQCENTVGVASLASQVFCFCQAP